VEHKPIYLAPKPKKLKVSKKEIRPFHKVPNKPLPSIPEINRKVKRENKLSEMELSEGLERLEKIFSRV
jgi:hypothetical protein